MRIPLPLSCFFSSLFSQSITTTCVGGCMALHCTCPQRRADDGVRKRGARPAAEGQQGSAAAAKGARGRERGRDASGARARQ
jgi:hypothetical protein